MSDQKNRIRDLDILNLAQPIGVLCQKYVNLDEGNFDARVLTLKEIYEVLLKLITAIGVKVYLSEADDHKDNKYAVRLNKGIDALREPSLGSWLYLLTTISSLYSKRSEEPPTFIREILRFYTANISGGENGEVYQAALHIKSFLKPSSAVPTMEWLCSLMANVRNKLGPGGHGASLRSVDMGQAAESLETVVAYILRRASFVSNLDLFYVRKAEREKGRTVYSVLSIGDLFEYTERFTQKRSPTDTCVDKEIYFARVDRTGDGDPVIQQAVSLSPLVTYQTCSLTKSEQVFIYNGKRGKGLEYLSYSTGGYYWPPDLQDEFDNIGKVIRGEVKAAEIFRRVDGDPERVRTAEERKAAEREALNALDAVRHDVSESALKLAQTALRFDNDCGLAYLARGLGYCRLGRLSEAIAAFKQSVNLAAEEPSCLLAYALVLVADGQEDAARDSFLKLKRVDATNEFVETAFDESGDLPDRLFRRGASLEQKLLWIVDQVFRQRDTDQQEIHSWLYRLPPWRQIYSLSKRRRCAVSPVVSSAVGALLLFLIPIAVHAGLLARWGFWSGPAKAMYARHGIVAFSCFFGMWNIFAFNALLRRVYSDLSRMVLMPRAAFRNWFMSEMGRACGSANFLDDPLPRTSFRGLLARDKAFFLLFVIIILACLVPHYYDAGDYDWNESFPSELFSSVSNEGAVSVSENGEEKNLRKEYVPEQLRKSQFVVRHSAYYIQVYLCAWCIVFIVGFIPFFARIMRLPIRYFPGIPSSMTLRAVTSVFIVFFLFGLVFCACVVAQLIVYDCIDVVPFAAWFYVFAVGVILPFYLLVPVIGIGATMRSQRDRVLEEFSAGLEQLYGQCVSTSEKSSYESMKESAAFMASLRRMCPVFPLSFGTGIVALILFVSNYAMIAGYFYAVRVLNWPQFQ